MCTAIALNDEGLYFGRTLDYDFSYPSQVVIAPRNFPFRMQRTEPLLRHYCLMGMAFVKNGYPLFFDAFNEEGLSMAGLNFEGVGRYSQVSFSSENIAYFELIPYILGTCRNVPEARAQLLKINITGESFSPDLPVAHLHYIIADSCESITLEVTEEGLRVYDNPTGVLTNNPPFPFQVQNLENYLNVSPKPAENRFSEKIEFSFYSRGMGALGLPGDYSSMSRFVRAAFLKLNSPAAQSEQENVSRFFGIMDSVSVPKGACVMENGNYQETLYTCLMSANRGVYYYTTKENRRVSAVDMKKVDKRGSSLICYPLRTQEDIFLQN